NGSTPLGGLVQDSSGNLYGTTRSGGAASQGTVFRISTASALPVTTLASFSSGGGTKPAGALVADNFGNLFGVTEFGGAAGYGTVFEVQASNGNITTLASFNSTDGAYPEGRLVRDSNGNLFGTTFAGGTTNRGTVFEVQAGSGTITTLASFTGAPDG